MLSMAASMSGKVRMEPARARHGCGSIAALLPLERCIAAAAAPYLLPGNCN